MLGDHSVVSPALRQTHHWQSSEWRCPDGTENHCQHVQRSEARTATELSLPSLRLKDWITSNDAIFNDNYDYFQTMVSAACCLKLVQSPDIQTCSETDSLLIEQCTRDPTKRDCVFNAIETPGCKDFQT